MRSTPKDISSKPKMTKGKAITVFAIIGVLIVMGAVFAFVSLDNGQLGVWDYKAFPSAISLGLDMKGGVYAVFEANTSNTTDLSSRMDGTVDQLSKMLYDKGYTEATVSKVGEDDIVSLLIGTQPVHKSCIDDRTVCIKNVAGYLYSCRPW